MTLPVWCSAGNGPGEHTPLQWVAVPEAQRMVREQRCPCGGELVCELEGYNTVACTWPGCKERAQHNRVVECNGCGAPLCQRHGIEGMNICPLCDPPRRKQTDREIIIAMLERAGIKGDQCGERFVESVEVDAGDEGCVMFYFDAEGKLLRVSGWGD